MKKILLLFIVCFQFSCYEYSNNRSASIDGEPVVIKLDLSEIEHHELRISYTITGVPFDTLFMRMPQSSPGRYALHQFAKNVYSEAAGDGNGNAISWVKTDVSEWAIFGHDGTVKFEYTLYANRAGGTYTGVDNRKVHLNMPATFMYPVELDTRKVELEFDLSNQGEWTVATQLEKIDDTHFMASDFYYFYDSPTIAGNIDWRTWEVTSNSKTQSIRIAMMHEGTDEELDDYTEWVKKVVAESEIIFGELPEFDYGEYTFLTMYNPWVFGDGMEHRNSTICSSRGNLANNAGGLIGTISHEFFHCWNVERIRPETLEPFNFDKPNLSGELWFAEGFTSYYDGLILKRAGIQDSVSFVSSLAGTLNYVINSPGRRFKNIIEMSRHAPFVDAATAIDETNFSNIFTSYYSYGSAIGLALDLTIRAQFPGKSLDDLMKYMWQNYGKVEKPYTIENIEFALAETTGNPEFSGQFFDNFIYKSNFPDMMEILQPFGIEINLRNPGKAGFPGLQLSYSPNGAEVQSPILTTNPLYEAGVTNGDVILELNGKPIVDEGDFFINYELGNSYLIKYIQRGETKERTFIPTEDQSFTTSFIEASGGKPTANQLQNRRNWLETKVRH